jgi:hypothetical protein
MLLFFKVAELQVVHWRVSSRFSLNFLLMTCVLSLFLSDGRDALEVALDHLKVLIFVVSASQNDKMMLAESSAPPLQRQEFRLEHFASGEAILLFFPRINTILLNLIIHCR